jgi:hypothetical protein
MHRPARAHAATPFELERHRVFLAKLINPIWLDGPEERPIPSMTPAIDVNRTPA